MTAAIALAVLLAGSMLIVRVASVILRLTGMPAHIARFQSVSALTGSGFTTTESEAIVNHPSRRRVVVVLMVLGNLGLVSVVSTFLVSLTPHTGDMWAFLYQVGLFALVVLLTGIVMLSKSFDQALCQLIETALKSTFGGEPLPFEILVNTGSGLVIARHIWNPSDAPGQSAPKLDEAELKLVSIDEAPIISGDASQFPIGARLILAGSVEAHQRFAITAGNTPNL